MLGVKYIVQLTALQSCFPWLGVLSITTDMRQVLRQQTPLPLKTLPANIFLRIVTFRQGFAVNFLLAWYPNTEFSLPLTEKTPCAKGPS